MFVMGFEVGIAVLRRFPPMRFDEKSNSSTSSSFPKGVIRQVCGPTQTTSTKPICISFRLTAENVSRSSGRVGTDRVVSGSRGGGQTVY